MSARRYPRAPRRALLTLAIAALSLPLALPLAGCSWESHRTALKRMAANGDYVAAARDLDDPATQDLYGDKERTLWQLERGAVALALDDADGAIEALSAAEDRIEATFGPNAGDQIASALINDRLAPYRPAAYEDQYVNVLKLLAQLEAGRIQGGASVEARRMATKANVLRDRYLDARREIVDQGVDEATGVLERREQVVGTTDGEFVESPLGTFLTALTFMQTGDTELQKVAARRLESAIVAQGGLIGPVDPADFAGLEEARPEDINLLVVGLSGRGPWKEAQRVGPIVIYEVSVYFEIPVLTGGSGEVTGARAVIVEAPDIPDAPPAGARPGARDPDGDSVNTLGMAIGAGQQSGWTPGTPVAQVPLALVEDLRSVAYANYEREMPLIYARTLLRAGAKAAGAYALTQVAKANSSGDTQVALQIGSVIAGLIYQMATEQADTRTWTFLPGKAHVGLAKLPPGRYRVRVEYLGGTPAGAPGGVIYTSPWRDVEVTERGLTSVVEHFWR